MSDANTHDLIVNLPIILAAVASIISAVKISNSAGQISQTGPKLDVLLQKTDGIHALANSNLAKQTAALEAANVRIEALHKELSAIKPMLAPDVIP